MSRCAEGQILLSGPSQEPPSSLWCGVCVCCSTGKGDDAVWQLRKDNDGDDVIGAGGSGRFVVTVTVRVEVKA